MRILKELMSGQDNAHVKTRRKDGSKQLIPRGTNSSTKKYHGTPVEEHEYRGEPRGDSRPLARAATDYQRGASSYLKGDLSADVAKLDALYSGQSTRSTAAQMPAGKRKETNIATRRVLTIIQASPLPTLRPVRRCQPDGRVTTLFRPRRTHLTQQSQTPSQIALIPCPSPLFPAPTHPVVHPTPKSLEFPNLPPTTNTEDAATLPKATSPRRISTNSSTFHALPLPRRSGRRSGRSVWRTIPIVLCKLGCRRKMHMTPWRR